MRHPRGHPRDGRHARRRTAKIEKRPPIGKFLKSEDRSRGSYRRPLSALFVNSAVPNPPAPGRSTERYRWSRVRGRRRPALTSRPFDEAAGTNRNFENRRANPLIEYRNSLHGNRLSQNPRKLGAHDRSQSRPGARGIGSAGSQGTVLDPFEGENRLRAPGRWRQGGKENGVHESPTPW